MSGAIDKAVGKSNQKLKAISETSKNIAMGSLAAGTALAAPLYVAADAAVSFEDKMADVGKVIGATTGSDRLDKMGDQVRDLSIFLAKAPDDVAALYANLATGGVAEANLLKVATSAGKIGVAFNITADAAGSAFPKIKNALGTTIEETELLMDAVNHLGNTVAAKSPEILEFLTAGGASGAATLGVAGEKASAFGASLIAMGKSAAEAGTIYERFSRAIAQNSKLFGMFQKAGGGEKGLLTILETGMKLQGLKRSEFFQQFGMYGTQVQLLAERMTNEGGLIYALDQVREKSIFAGSAALEFQNRMGTTATKLKQAQVQFDVLTIEIGNKLIPVLLDVIEKITPVINAFRNFVSDNPKTTTALLLIAGGLSAIFFAAAGLATAVWAFTGAAAAMGTISGVASIGVGALTTSLSSLWFGLSIMTGGLLPLIVGIIGAVIALGAVIYNYWDDIAGFFVSSWASISKAFSDGISWIKTNWAQLIPFLINPLLGLGTLIMMAFENFFPDVYAAGANIAKSIGEGIMSGIKWVTDAISNVTKAARDYLPFSPAKEGAFKDLHRVKIVETIAGSIKPGPMVNAMKAATFAATMSISPGANSASLPPPPISNINTSTSNSGITINYNPVITIGPGGNAQQADEVNSILKLHSKELLRMIEDELARKQSRKF